MRKTLSLLAFTATMMLSGVALSQTRAKTDDVRMTWFGITNWYYEIGDTGIFIDGVVSKFNEKGAKSDEGLVERVYEALDRGTTAQPRLFKVGI